MANTVKMKRSAVAGKVPATTDLDLGEIAINTYDGVAYIKKDVSGTQTVVPIGVGDVTSSSASSIDNAITRFDGTTGKVIQNSTVTLDDAGNIANANSVQFDTTPTVPTATGAMYWDEGNGTPSINLNADVTLQLGQEIVTLVYNGTGSTITNGSVVAVAGAQGQRPSVVLADADSESTSASTLGIATQDIADGTEGFITSFGFVRGVNTSGITAGAPIYLSQTAGQFTATRPSAPAHTVILGWVIKVNASSGEIFVHINNGWELDELHNVLISSPTSGNTLIYDASAGVWKNANLTAGSGISITNGAGSITIAATNAGTVTNVTATSPILSTGGATPNISMPAATTSVSGYLTSTDWNTFNGKGNGTVTSVGITAGAGISVSGSPITSSGNITVSVASIASSMIYDSFTATASQTSFTTTQSYTSGKISVFKNGAKMRNGSDVTVTSGSAVVFAVACTLNDVVDIEYPTTSLSGNFIYDTFTATASQTTFTSSQTYTSGKIDVYANGVKMRNGSDVTVTSGTSVVFATGLPVGSLVDLVYPV